MVVFFIYMLIVYDDEVNLAQKRRSFKCFKCANL